MFINGVEIPYLIANAIEITQAEYDALVDKSGTYIIKDAVSVPVSASNVSYSNTTSGLLSTDVQGAVDELAARPVTADAEDVNYDNTTSGLGATDVQGAIDELTEIIGSTLSAGATTVSFTDSRITVNSAIDPYVWVADGSTVDIIAPTAIAVSTGSCTLTFDAQSSDVLVGIRVF